MDTGVGYPPAQQSRIFEAFVQQDSSTTRRYGGTGLGLTICRQIVSAMGGKIWSESTVGIGSTFYFTIALDNHQESTSPQKTPQRVNDSNEKSLQILVVEDELVIQILINDFLKDTPHDLFYAENGKEALKIVKNKDIDLIFMDLRMPVMDGYSATQVIQTWEENHSKFSTPIIALSASVMAEDVEKCLSTGFTTHLSKPVRKSQLLQIISDYGNHHIN